MVKRRISRREELIEELGWMDENSFDRQTPPTQCYVGSQFDPTTTRPAQTIWLAATVMTTISCFLLVFYSEMVRGECITGMYINIFRTEISNGLAWERTHCQKGGRSGRTGEKSGFKIRSRDVIIGRIVVRERRALFISTTTPSEDPVCILHFIAHHFGTSPIN